jgi:hypothetical protein
MATPYELLQAQVRELTREKKHLTDQLCQAHKVHEQYKIEKQQKQDLLFACLHTLGPHVQIEIDRFHDFFKDAQFDGNLHMTDEGRYVVRLQFYQEGIEMHWRRKLLLGDTSVGSLAQLQANFNEALQQNATPQEAYTLAINKQL